MQGSGLQPDSGTYWLCDHGKLCALPGLHLQLFNERGLDLMLQKGPSPGARKAGLLEMRPYSFPS